MAAHKSLQGTVRVLCGCLTQQDTIIDNIPNIIQPAVSQDKDLPNFGLWDQLVLCRVVSNCPIPFCVASGPTAYIEFLCCYVQCLSLPSVVPSRHFIVTSSYNIGLNYYRHSNITARLKLSDLILLALLALFRTCNSHKQRLEII